MTTQLSHTSHATSRPTPALLSLIAGMLFLASCTTPVGTGKREADFTHYDEPLYEQMTDRIKARVMARLGEGTNTHDRYFIIPYAYQNKGNDPAFSHSFLSVIRVYAVGTAPTRGATSRLLPSAGCPPISRRIRTFACLTGSAP
jgi:hypothetical protein